MWTTSIERCFNISFTRSIVGGNIYNISYHILYHISFHISYHIVILLQLFEGGGRGGVPSPADSRKLPNKGGQGSLCYHSALLCLHILWNHHAQLNKVESLGNIGTWVIGLTAFLTIPRSGALNYIEYAIPPRHYCNIVL